MVCFFVISERPRGCGISLSNDRLDSRTTLLLWTHNHVTTCLLSRITKMQLNGLTLSQTIILYSSSLKEFADDNSKFDENGGKFSETIENTVGKEEIARHEQFLLFPQCFQKTCTADK